MAWLEPPLKGPKGFETKFTILNSEKYRVGVRIPTEAFAQARHRHKGSNTGNGDLGI